MLLRYFLILTLFYACISQAQGAATVLQDSLKEKGFDYIYNQIESEKLAAKRPLYLKAFISKAKREQNWEELSNAYKNYVHYAPDNQKLIYADSMVSAAKETEKNTIIGSAYLSKGIAYYGQKKLDKALDYYLIANSFILKTNDKYLLNKNKYNIAQIKYLLGYYPEAEKLFLECIVYLEHEDKRGYLNCLHSLGLCYSKSGNFGLCSSINKKGITQSILHQQSDMLPYFTLSEGVNQCMMHNYTMAIEKLRIALPQIPEKDFANRTVGTFYIGKSYWQLGRKELAISYFMQVDQSYKERDYIRPDLREAYELMISYYKEKNDVKMQLQIIETLLEVDKHLNATYRYLQGKITKDYDTKTLLEQKQKIEKSLKQRQYHEIIFISIIILLLVLVALLIVRHFTLRRRLRKKYEELLGKLEASSQAKEKEEDEPMYINEDSVSKILYQIGKFEQGKKFLEKDLNLTKLAVYFGTNTTYLSKIILHHRGKKFSEYLNDLKIDYISQRIRNEKLLRKYNYKALAEEAGFSTTRRFSNAFLARTGITPIYFIEELKKDEAVQE